MIDSYIYIIDDLVFFCTGLLLLYLFVMAIASHFKHITYPKAQKEYGCAILVPEGSILPDVYKEEEYEFITYSDLYQAINSLDQERYDLVLFLSNTACALSPQFLNKIYNAYDAGVQAIQLHTIVENRKGIRNRFRAIREEIKNSLCRAGNTQFGLSSNLLGTNMAIDLKWLQKNMKSSKTNIERKLFRQNIYIDYLPDVIVYCQSAPACPYRKRIRKTTSYLLPSIFEGNWSFCNRIVQQLTPSPLKLCIFVSIWTSLITVYNWTLSFGWWIALFGLLITYSLAIPDYLVEDKKKKKHSIWRRKTLKQRIKENPGLKQAVHRFIMHPVKTRPNWWIRLFDFIYLKRGKGSVIYRSVRKDLPPFNRFSLGKYSVVEDFSCLNNAVGDLTIGDYTRIGLRNTIIGPVNIGNHVNLAQNVTVTGLNHNYQDAEKMIDEQGVSTLPVVIEDDVWVGANSVILPGVTLGKHCVVAAGSVVSHSVPPYSICAGCPARIIKTYDFETKEWKKVEKTPATNHK